MPVNTHHIDPRSTLGKWLSTLRRLSLLSALIFLAYFGGLLLLTKFQPQPVLAQGGTHTLPLTSVADFDTCTTLSATANRILTNVTISQVADGELRLAAPIEDYFENSDAVDTTKWLTGLVNGGGKLPMVANGLLTITASWIRSKMTFAQNRLAVEGRIRFGDPDTGWADFGFGKPDHVSGSPNILVITNDQQQLFANSYHPDNEPADPRRDELTGLNTNGFHEFRLIVDDWEHIDYQVDGVVRASHVYTQPVFTTPAYLWLYTLQLDDAVQADWIRVAHYEPTGSYVSCVQDAGLTVRWKTLSWAATTPTGTTLAFRTRTSPDGVNWSGWSEPLTQNDAALPNPPGRYLQYQAEFATNDVIESPEVQAITLTTQAVNSFDITLPATGQVGQPFNAAIRLVASDGVTVDDQFTGTVTLSSDNGGLISPSQVHLVAGEWTGAITLTAAGEDRAVQATYGGTTGVGYIDLDPYQFYLPLIRQEE